MGCGGYFSTSSPGSFKSSPRARLEVVVSVDEISHVLRAFATHLTAVIGRPMERARRILIETLRPSGVTAGFVADMFRTTDELLAENAALRQQLIVASRKVREARVGGRRANRPSVTEANQLAFLAERKASMVRTK